MSNSEGAHQIQSQVESAVDEIIKYYERRKRREIVFGRILRRERHAFQKNHELPIPPESFIEDVLVKELLEILGYEYSGETKIAEKALSDFLITSTNEVIIGEVKPPGEIYQGYGQMLRYFDSSDYKYGIVTDGLYWELIEYENSPGVASAKTLEYGELRGIVADYVYERSYIDGNVAKLDNNISPTSSEKFYSRLNFASVNEKL